MRNRERDLAAVLLRKAREDLTALERWIGDEPTPDGVLGFHAQQAVEKFLKAVLASRGVRFERTHDIRYLLELLEESGSTPPAPRADLVALTEYAVELRYDEPFDEEPFDRGGTLELVRVVSGWADQELA